MAVRPLEVLRREQAEMADRMRAAAGESPPPAPLSERSDAVATVGRVAEVVASDAVYGAHLVVQPQVFSGAPATASDAATPTMRAYPTPNHVVGEYAVDEYVQLLTCRGAVVGLKLS
jgi:hypothetical protein